MCSIPPSFHGDARWRGQGIAKVTLMLFVFIIAVISISTVEIVATVNINAITAAALGAITLVHTVVDMALYLNSKLKPVYVVAMSSIMFTFWLTFSVWEIVEMVFVGYDDGYGYFQCSIVDLQGYDDKPSGQSCALPKARFSFSWILVFLYIASIVYSARALKREKKDRFQRQVDQAVLALQAVAPPILGCPQCGAQMLPHRVYTDLPTPQYVQGNPGVAIAATDNEKTPVEPTKGYIFP